MKQKNKVNYKSDKGVTIVALVITIIVLLILAGVSINMVLGDEGIMTNAQEAKNKNNASSEKEIINLAVITQRTTANFTGIDKDKLVDSLKSMLGDNAVDVKVDENNNELIIVETENATYEIVASTGKVTVRE